MKTLDLLVQPSGYLILSWAIEGQGGTGHVNCQNNKYVIQLLSDMNYTHLVEDSLSLRSKISQRCFWFRETIMVFKKNE